MELDNLQSKVNVYLNRTYRVSFANISEMVHKAFKEAITDKEKQQILLMILALNQPCNSRYMDYKNWVT